MLRHDYKVIEERSLISCAALSADHPCMAEELSTRAQQ